MPPEPAATALAPQPDLSDAGFLASLRVQMVKFAHLHLSDRHLAEDAVQEALAGALQGAQRFAGRAALKTWVFAILKHKVADLLRHKQRVVDASSLLKEGEDDPGAELFTERGHWLKEATPQTWHCPEASLSQQQFWAVLEVCLDGMPPAQARVFMMREFMGFETQEICDTVQVSQANFFVMMHRARLRLRECLDQRWFAGQAGGAQR
jgi:RNA polymerase sigma-70 factor (ECF subfamily)